MLIKSILFCTNIIPLKRLINIPYEKHPLQMMQTEFQYMVDFTLPDILTEEFMELIPFQRVVVNKYFKEGKLLNYALSLENAKLWAIFKANSEFDVIDMIADLPLTSYMSVEISMLTFYNTMDPTMPQFSVN